MDDLIHIITQDPSIFLMNTMYFILLFSLSCINDGYDFKYWMYFPVDLTK